MTRTTIGGTLDFAPNEERPHRWHGDRTQKREQHIARAALFLDGFLAGTNGREAVERAYQELADALSE